MTEEILFSAIKEAVKKAGSQTKLAEQSGLTPGRISDYICGRKSLMNMSLATFFHIFPLVEIDFFGKKNQGKISGTNIISDVGSIQGEVTQNSGTSIFSHFLGKRNLPTQQSPLGSVDLRDLERKIRKSNKFTPEERLKILDFFDEEL